MSKCYNIGRKYVDFGSLEPDVHSKTSIKGDAVNALKKFLAMLATLAFSLIGVGADLPFGETAWKNHVATNGYITLISVFQYDQESGHEAEFWPGQEGTKFKSYDEFLDYVQRTLDHAEQFITEELGYDPELPLQVYIATSVQPANTIPGHYGVDDFIFVLDMMPTGDGHWHFPDGFLGTITLEYNTWQVLPLRKKAASAKLSYTNRVTGHVDEQDTAEANGLPERLVKVNERGSVSVREDFVWGNPDYDLRLTVRYTDGKTETWDENGKDVSTPIPVVPATLTMVSGESGLRLSLKGTVGQRVIIQKLAEHRYWEDVRTVVFTNATINIPYNPGTTDHELFRLTE